MLYLNTFVFGDFNVHHNDWLTYSGSNRSGELFYNFFISDDLTEIISFATGIPDCDSYSPAPLNLVVSPMLVFVLLWLFLQWGIVTLMLYQVLLSFHQTQNGISCLHDLLRDVHGSYLDRCSQELSWEDIFNLSVSAAACEFC